MGNIPTRVLAATGWIPAEETHGRGRRAVSGMRLIADLSKNEDVRELILEGAEFLRDALLVLETEVGAGGHDRFAKEEDGIYFHECSIAVVMERLKG